MVESAPLLREYGLIAHRGFESLALRHFSVFYSLVAGNRSSMGSEILDIDSSNFIMDAIMFSFAEFTSILPCFLCLALVDSELFSYLISFACLFLFVFSWFKDAAIEVFKKELESSQNINSIWSKLFKVFLVDWIICVFGVLGTGILFVVILNFAH